MKDARRLDIGPSRVITSHPWPEPETLRLQGVAGPNCELFLFKVCVFAICPCLCRCFRVFVLRRWTGWVTEHVSLSSTCVENLSCFVHFVVLGCGGKAT